MTIAELTSLPSPYSSITVRMLQTRCGSEDGFKTRYYKQGNVYPLGNLLANQFISKGWAVGVEAA